MTKYRIRALMLALRLQADVIHYTPRSHKGARALRLLPRLISIVQEVQS